MRKSPWRGGGRRQRGGTNGQDDGGRGQDAVRTLGVSQQQQLRVSDALTRGPFGGGGGNDLKILPVAAPEDAVADAEAAQRATLQRGIGGGGGPRLLLIPEDGTNLSRGRNYN